MDLTDLRLDKIKEEAGDYTAEAIRRLRDRLNDLANTVKYNDESSGLWEDVTYASSLFTGKGSMTWGVDSTDVSYLTWSLDRNVLQYRGSIILTDVGGTADTQLRVKLPAGLSITGPNTTGYLLYRDAGGARTVGAAIAASGADYVAFEKVDGSNWTLTTGDNTSIIFSITCEVNK